MDRTFGFENKLNRASRHLKNLEQRIQRWLALPPYRLVDELDSNGDRVVTVDPIIPPSPEIAVLVGDCVYNLRSALDHIAYTLAITNIGDPLPDTVARGSEFPIFGHAALFEKHRARKIGSIISGAQTIIERLQPYNSGHSFRLRPLWILNELSNIDKHRTLHFALAAYRGTQLPIPFMRYSAQFKKVGLLEHKTEVVRYRSLSHGRAKVDFAHFFDVAFAQEPVRGRSVSGTLRTLRDYVASQVLEPLSKFL